MVEFWFKYPAAVFEKGQFVFASGRPVWLLALLVAAAAAALGWHIRRERGRLSTARVAAAWALQSGLVALLLALL